MSDTTPGGAAQVRAGGATTLVVKPDVLPLVLDVVALALAGAGNALLAARSNQAPLALCLVGIALVIRLAQVRTRFLQFPLLLPVLLFLASAWIGVTISFDPLFSLRKFFLIAGGVALLYVIAATQTDPAKRLVVWGLLLIGAGVGLFYLTQTNFTDYPLKIGVLDQIAAAIHRASPQLGLYTPHPNLMAGILLLALPFAAALAYQSWRTKNYVELVVSGAFTLWLAFALVMTTSRGALLAIVLLGGLAIYGTAAIRLAKRGGYSAGLGLAAAFNLLLIVVLLALAVGGSRLGNALGGLLGAVNGVPRPQLYQQVIQLGQDYAFTGAGLDAFSPNYSTYELLINVHLLAHAHNLLLQVWFEQGILGAIAFMWLIVAYFVWVARRQARVNWLAFASVAATSLMLLHGVVDVLFYFSRVISLMFIPIGLTICALQPFTPLQAREPTFGRGRVVGAAAAGALVLIAALVLLAGRETLTAQWDANWGALKQSQLELSKVRDPRPTYSEVRRSVDLTDAQALYLDALERDPKNRTAHARLGMIALDRYEFQTALEHLQAAYDADKTNRPVIKSLGYTYLWTGDMERAEALLKQIPEASVELGYTGQEWRKLGREELATRAQRMIQRLNP